MNFKRTITFDVAYMVYEFYYDRWATLSDQDQKRARRQVESMIREGGFNGKSTGLISAAALQTIVNEKKGIRPSNSNRTALEHPITYTNIARFCLEAKQKLSFEEYVNVWFTNLITTVTTNEENQHLRKFQKDFVFGVDSWQDMYAKAGVTLVKRPNFRRNDVKQQYGII
jgi:hypothetical protein